MEKCENTKNEDIPGCGSCVVCPEGPRKHGGALKKYVVQIVHSHTLIEWRIYFNFIVVNDDPNGYLTTSIRSLSQPSTDFDSALCSCHMMIIVIVSCVHHEIIMSS